VANKLDDNNSARRRSTPECLRAMQQAKSELSKPSRASGCELASGIQLD
jgi:hypothetical protein